MTAESTFAETKKDIPWTTGIFDSAPSTKTVVSDKFAEMLVYADEAWDTATALIATLTDSTTIPDPDFADISLSELTMPSIDDVTKPVAPEAPSAEIEIEDAPDNSAVIFQDENIAINTLLDTKIQANLNAGGTGLGSEIEAAIWARATTRLTEDRTLKIAEANADLAARGWTAPNGALEAKVSQVTRDFTKRLEEISEQIAVEQAKLAQTNEHFTLEQALKYVTVARDWLSQKTNFLLKKFELEIDAWKTVSGTTIAELDAKVKLYGASASAYASEVQAEKTFIESKIEIINASLTEFKENFSFAVDREKLRLDKWNLTSNLDQTGIQYGSQFTSQLAASALGAINTTAQISASSSIGETVGYSYKYGQSISESVQNQETYLTTLDLD